MSAPVNPTLRWPAAAIVVLSGLATVIWVVEVTSLPDAGAWRFLPLAMSLLLLAWGIALLVRPTETAVRAATWSSAILLGSTLMWGFTILVINFSLF